MGDINTKVSVSGAEQYKAKMGELKSSSKALDSEMQKLTSGFDQNTSAAEKTAAKQELLGRQIDNQKAIVDALAGNYGDMVTELARLQQAAEDAAKANGNESEAAKKAALEVTRFQTATNNAETELNKATAKLNQMQNSMEDVGEEAEQTSPKVSAFGDVLKANLASDAIKAGVSGLVDMVKDLAKWMGSLVIDSAAFADEILTLSTTTGMSTDALQEYKYMAELTDVSLEAITGAQTQLTKTMASAAGGNKAAAAKFEKFGVAVQNADGSLRGADEVLSDVLTALSGIANETELDATAMDILGKSAQDLKPLLELGADGLEAFRQEAHEAGYVLSEDQLQALGKVDDGYQRLQKRIEGLKHNLGAELAPAADAVFDALEKIASKVDWDKFGESVSDISEQFATWTENLNFDDITDGIQKAVDAASKLVQALENISSVIDFLSGNNLSGGASLLYHILNPVEVPGLLDGLNTLQTVAQQTQTTMDLSGGQFLDDMEAGTQVVDNLTSGFSGFAGKLDAEVTPAVEDMAETFEGAGDQVSALADESPAWGADMVSGFSRGFDREAPKMLKKVNLFAEDIRAMLHFSRPDKGPLRDYETWMPDFMAGLARTMEANQWRVEESTAAAANAIAAGMDLNRSNASLGDQIGAGNAELIDAVRGINSNVGVQVTLEGDAGDIFHVVRTQNNRIANATGYNKLGRSGR